MRLGTENGLHRLQEGEGGRKDSLVYGVHVYKCIAWWVCLEGVYSPLCGVVWLAGE